MSAILSVNLFISAFGLPLISNAAPTIPDAVSPGGAIPRSLEGRPPISDQREQLSIPKLIDRPLGVEEGDRVMVREFVINGIKDYPEYGIRVEDISFIAEANRVKRQRLSEADMKGFTANEVDDIAEFIRRLVEEPNQRPTSAELWKLVFKLRKEEWSRGLTIGQIQEVADEITRYYRQHGLILATAYVPAQEVKEGKIIIEVLEGTFGTAQADSNKMYSSKMIERPFNDLKGKVVHKKSIESSLLYLTDYPGLNVSGILQPGKVQGESDLILKVLGEDRVNGAVQVDNNGSEFTGRYRSRFDLSVNNPSGRADQLNLTLLQNMFPFQGTYGGFAYQYPVLRQDLHIGLTGNYNQFDASEDTSVSGGIDVDGKSITASGFLKKSFQRNRNYNSYGLVEVSRKFAKSMQRDNLIQRSEYSVARLELGFDMIDTRFAGINVGVLNLTQGLGTKLGGDGFSGIANKVDEGGFRKVNLSLSRLQTVVRNVSVLLTSHLQYASDRLNSLEQMAVGGADSVRAFPVSEYLRDVGYNLSAEVIFNAPGFADKPAFAGRSWGEVFNVSVFYDAGGGWLRNANAAETREVHLQGAGVAMKLSLPGKFKVRLQAAKVTSNDKPLNNEAEERFYFDLAYYF